MDLVGFNSFEQGFAKRDAAENFELVNDETKADGGCVSCDCTKRIARDDVSDGYLPRLFTCEVFVNDAD